MEKRLRFKKARGNLCMPIILITVAHEGRRNVMTAAWNAPSSFAPPLTTIFIGTTRFTHDLIMKSGEFAINVLADDQMDLATHCGNTSGRDVDKFKEGSIAVRSAKKIIAPLVLGCTANLECKVKGYFLTGDHTAFVGETVAYIENTAKVPLVRFRGMFYRIGQVLGTDEHKSKV